MDQGDVRGVGRRGRIKGQLGHLELHTFGRTWSPAHIYHRQIQGPEVTSCGKLYELINDTRLVFQGSVQFIGHVCSACSRSGLKNLIVRICLRSMGGVFALCFMTPFTQRPLLPLP